MIATFLLLLTIPHGCVAQKIYGRFLLYIALNIALKRVREQFTFDCNFHSVTHCSYRVRCFTFILSSVFFTGVVNDEVGFADV